MMERAKKFFDTHQLLFLVLGALTITVILTSVSMHLYVSSGASKLDLSRPGYEKVRENVTQNPTDEKPYSTTGPLDATAIQDFDNRYNRQRAEMNDLGDFGSDALSDSALNLNVSDELTD